MEELKSAQKDFLTGFYNREYLISTLLKKIVDAKMRKEEFSVLLVDIDHFKKINDKYGHLWGDEFLKYVASTLRLSLESKGLIFRYGGDEFVVIFTTTSPKKAFLLARQFNLVMRSRPFLFNGRLFKLTISCGLASYPEDAQSAEALLAAADRALYFSKRYGRNTTTVASKIGLQRLKITLVIFLEVLFFAGLSLLAFGRVHQGVFRGAFERLAISRLVPAKVEADTKIVLTTGDVFLGRIVAEDAKMIIMEVALGQGSCTMNIEKALIQKTVPITSESK
ncbi:GGDEF domain-containing protein [Candidatus Omnitrophota bacterium]